MTAPEIYIKALAAPGRKAEREAVDELIAEAFGPDTELYHRPDGSPAVDIEGVEISISHCRTCAVLAVADRPVGVDVETDRAQRRQSDVGRRSRILQRFIGKGMDSQGSPL